MIAVDTNVLVGAIQTFDPALRVASRRALKALYRQGQPLSCFPQNLVEFWNVATRPARANGLGFVPEQAAGYTDRFLSTFRLFPDTPEIFPVWRELVLRYGISGIQVHDARIVAAMAVHQVSHILTFDRDDFKRYGIITVIDPHSV